MPCVVTGAIGVACAAVETGLIRVTEPQTSFVLETAAGLIPMTVHIQGGRVLGATFRNAPVFLFFGDVSISLPDGQGITVDVAYGGVPIILVDSEMVGLPVSPETVDEAIRLGSIIRRRLAQAVELRHPDSSARGHMILSSLSLHRIRRGC